MLKYSMTSCDLLTELLNLLVIINNSCGFFFIFTVQPVFGFGGEPGPSVPVLLSVQSRFGLSPLQHQSTPFHQIAAQRVPVVSLSPAQSSLRKKFINFFFTVHPVPPPSLPPFPLAPPSGRR